MGDEARHLNQACVNGHMANRVVQCRQQVDVEKKHGGALKRLPPGLDTALELRSAEESRQGVAPTDARAKAFELDPASSAAQPARLSRQAGNDSPCGVAEEGEVRHRLDRACGRPV